MVFTGPFDQAYFESGTADPADPGYSSYPRVASWMPNVAADIEAEVGPLNGLDVLEAGCAYGILADLLAALGANVTGLDISAWAVGEAGTKSQPAANQLRTVATHTFAGAFAITEHGVFSVITSSTITLWDRSVFGAINVVASDAIEATYTCTVSSGG